MNRVAEFLKTQENCEYEEPGIGTYRLCKNGFVELELYNGYAIASDDSWEMQDFMQTHAKAEFRICEICGKPYSSGYMHDEGFHACSKECIAVDADKRYGSENWKWHSEASESEIKEAYEEIDEDTVGCLIFKNDDGKWELDETFYTEWF